MLILAPAPITRKYVCSGSAEGILNLMWVNVKSVFVYKFGSLSRWWQFKNIWLRNQSYRLVIKRKLANDTGYKQDVFWFITFMQVRRFYKLFRLCCFLRSVLRHFNIDYILVSSFIRALITVARVELDVFTWRNYITQGHCVLTMAASLQSSLTLHANSWWHNGDLK